VVFIRAKADWGKRRKVLSMAVVGTVAVVLGFAISTPFFLLDFSTAYDNVVSEARAEHIGADGLSYFGNLWWYLTVAIPSFLTWPITILAAIGAVALLVRRRADQLLVLGCGVLFILFTSAHPLHWTRWMIQVIPLLSLLAGHTLWEGAGWLYQRLHPLVRSRPVLALIALGVLSLHPAYEVLRYEIEEASPSTQIMAREWILGHIPPGSKVAKERYSAPLGESDLVVLSEFVLARHATVQEYYEAGFRYIVVSDAVAGRFLAEPERYPYEIAFYRELAERGRLLKEFTPSFLRGGPRIRIYELMGLDVDPSPSELETGE